MKVVCAIKIGKVIYLLVTKNIKFNRGAKMKKSLIFGLFLTILLLSIGVNASAESKEKVNWDGNTKDSLVINDSLKITKLEDGRVKPVNPMRLINLNDVELNEILIFMNHTDVEKIPRDIKVDMISAGGKGVESTEYNLKIESFDNKGNLVSKDLIDLNKKNTEFSTLALPSETTFCFTGMGCFDNNLGISYIGKSGTNFQYRFYNYYDWNGYPPFGHTDRIGLAWSADGKKKASSDYGTHYAWMSNLNYYVQKTMAINTTNVYGTVMNVPLHGVSSEYGSQKVDVYYPDRNAGDIEIIQGEYAHNWQTVSNGISIGPASIDIAKTYKTFTLEKNFTVGK